ncbi:hypothetical protein [Pseudooceanicola aestuarii]|uniref:hypothetical protein n=1 Tax=Pseudooceanicola aestuarii TaxID=2697319 RepID=UPI001EF778F6|nr:hypothetical protein [Pseudooceanicola aestuarii]
MTLRKIFSLAFSPALFLTAGCAMPPQGAPANASANFNDAVASVGCNLRTERDYLPVELQTGMTREQVIQMAQFKMGNGEAVALEDGGVKLVTGACA